MKSSCSFFSRLFYFILTGYLSLFFFLSFHFPDFFFSPHIFLRSLHCALPLFSVLSLCSPQLLSPSLFSIALSSPLLISGGVWVDGGLGFWSRRQSGLGFARRGFEFWSRRRSGLGFARGGLGFLSRCRYGCGLISAWAWVCDPGVG